MKAPTIKELSKLAGTFVPSGTVRIDDCYGTLRFYIDSENTRADVSISITCDNKTESKRLLHATLKELKRIRQTKKRVDKHL